MICLLLIISLLSIIELIIIYKQRKIFSYIQHEFPQKSNELIKFKHNYLLLYDWLILEKRGISVATYFMNCPYNSFAIYGYDLIGKLLIKELSKANIRVEYIIDQSDLEIKSDIKIYKRFDELPLVDLIVVTTNNLYEVKEKMYALNTKCVVVMFKDIVSMLLQGN